MQGKSWKTALALKANFYTITLQDLIFEDFPTAGMRIGGVLPVPKICSLPPYLNLQSRFTKDSSPLPPPL